MPKLEFVKIPRDGSSIHDYKIIIDGEHRATWSRLDGTPRYELNARDLEEYHVAITAESSEFKEITSGLLAAKLIPTIAEIAEYRKLPKPKLRRASGEQFHWVTYGDQTEPAQVEYRDGKAVGVWFIGMEDEVSADRCEIGEQIIRGQS